MRWKFNKISRAVNFCTRKYSLSLLFEICFKLPYFQTALMRIKIFFFRWRKNECLDFIGQNNFKGEKLTFAFLIVFYLMKQRDGNANVSQVFQRYGL